MPLSKEANAARMRVRRAALASVARCETDKPVDPGKRALAAV
jgi:hypothetical protein